MFFNDFDEFYFMIVFYGLFCNLFLLNIKFFVEVYIVFFYICIEKII